MQRSFEPWGFKASYEVPDSIANKQTKIKRNLAQISRLSILQCYLMLLFNELNIKEQVLNIKSSSHSNMNRNTDAIFTYTKTRFTDAN